MFSLYVYIECIRIKENKYTFQGVVPFSQDCEVFFSLHVLMKVSFFVLINMWLNINIGLGGAPSSHNSVNFYLSHPVGEEWSNNVPLCQ